MSDKEISLSVYNMKVLAKRELTSSLYGWGFYAAIFISSLVSSFILKNFLQGIIAENIFITSFPLNFPFFTSIIILQ